MTPLSPGAADILPRVQDLIAEVLSLHPNDVSPEARILLDLGAESIDLLDMRFRVEKEFGIKISNADLAAVVGDDADATRFATSFTVGAMADYLARRLATPDA
jgi:acyl carrier protein